LHGENCHGIFIKRLQGDSPLSLNLLALEVLYEVSAESDSLYLKKLSKKIAALFCLRTDIDLT